MTDTNPQVLKNAKKIFPEAKIVYPEEIHKEQVDVYSPCALGKEFNKKTINQLNCKMVCGAANNQLVTEDAGFELYKRNILYIPDYVANSGGLINVKDELNPHGYSRKRVENKVRRIGKTVKQIIEVSKKKKVPTDKVSNILAENIFLKKHV